MRFILPAVMLLGLLIGGPLRAIDCVNECRPVVENDCCGSHDSKKGHPEDQCPEGHHHHHGVCCHPAPAASAEENEPMADTDGSLEKLRFRPQNENIPEGPFLSSEKPPLI